MKAGQLFLAAAYLMMMVVLPIFHIATESCHTTSSNKVVHCDHAEPREHPHPEESPDHNEHSSDHNGHSPDSCSICHLMKMQIDFPDVLITTHVSVWVQSTPVVLDSVNSLQPILRKQARAPPFKTA